MPQKQINFTKKALLSLPVAEAGKRDYYRDTKTRGLVLAVTHAGTKSFQVYRWVEGRPERITVGRFPDLTVEQARGFADKINAEIATGHNPNDSRRQIRAEMTVAELFSVYLKTHAKVHKKSWQEDQGQYNRHLTRWARRKLSQVRGTDVQALHQKIGREKGLYAANRLLALLHAMFNKAIQWGWDGANPASGIQKFKEHSRERFLEAHELPRFFEAVAEEPNHTIRDYVLISLLTGARKSNVLAMNWDDISLESAVWSIPDTKNGSPHRIPLSKPALDILKARKRGSDSEFVFPGTGRTGHLMEPIAGWKRILGRAGITDCRIHDLRRTLGSWQAATGANLSIIGKTLAHKNVSTTAIYARLNLDPVKDAMTKATDAMLQAGGVESRSTVTKLHKTA